MGRYGRHATTRITDYTLELGAAKTTDTGSHQVPIMPKHEDSSNNQEQEIARLRHQLSDVQARLEQAHQRKSSLLVMASHDLRTPLAIIQGYSQLLTNELEPMAGSDVAEYLTNILAHTELLSNMVENLVALDQYERDEVRLTVAKSNLNDLIDHALAQIEGLTILKNLEIHYEAPIKPGWVCVDEDEIHRALFNALSHVIKYARPDSHLRVGIEQNDGFYRVELHDPNRYLPVETLTRLFTLTQISKDGVASLRGTDMGLVLTRHVIERHGGRVAAASAANQGLTIALYVPSDEC